MLFYRTRVSTRRSKHFLLLRLAVGMCRNVLTTQVYEETRKAAHPLTYHRTCASSCSSRRSAVPVSLCTAERKAFFSLFRESQLLNLKFKIVLDTAQLLLCEISKYRFIQQQKKHPVTKSRKWSSRLYFAARVPTSELSNQLRTLLDKAILHNQHLLTLLSPIGEEGRCQAGLAR